MKQNRRRSIELTVGLICAGTLAGCSHIQRKKEKAEVKLEQTTAALQEESRALTTAVVDLLSVAPANAPTVLALDLARHDQQIEGVPGVRIDTRALLLSDPKAIGLLTDRYVRQEKTMRQKELDQVSLRETGQKLEAMGQTYEAERNHSLVSRLWKWTLGTLGLGGLIAACILFPALIPMVGSLAGWMVGRVPGLASWFGVVGKRAFDNVVSGVGKARYEFKKAEDQKSLQLLNNELAKATDQDDRKLIEARREALKV